MTARSAWRPPALGVGVVWWPELAPLRERTALIQVVEAEPESYWLAHTAADGSRSVRSLLAEALRGLPQPKLLHGVGAPLGGSCPPPVGHTALFADDIAAVAPAWTSEHLSFSSFPAPDGNAGVHFAGFLLPPAQTPAGAEMCAANIRRRRSVLGEFPLAFETNVNYLPPRPGEIPDGDFAAHVAELADCGILLDLHNLICNERNGRQSAADFCAALPLDRVWELHLAGGAEMRGFYLDAHSGIVDAAVMALAKDLVPSLPNLGAIVFEIMPEYVPFIGLPAIVGQLEDMHALWALRAKPMPEKATSERTQHTYATSNPTIHPSTWEALLGSHITGLPAQELGPEIAAWRRKADPAFEIYCWLAGEARAGMLAVGAPRTIRLLLQRYGAARTRSLLRTFWSGSTPAYTAFEEADAFMSFAGAVDDAPGLARAIAEDRAALREIAETRV
jgi:uncharacterized protein (UPF0276 family)